MTTNHHNEWRMTFIHTYLQELRSSEVEHVLRVHAELLGEAECFRFVLHVLRELGAQADQAAVQPPHRVRHLIRPFIPPHSQLQKKKKEKAKAVLVKLEKYFSFAGLF